MKIKTLLSLILVAALAALGCNKVTLKPAIKAVALDIPRTSGEYSLPYSIENDYDVYHIALQLQIIKRDKIHSINGLNNMIQDVKKAHEECRQQLNKLDERSRQLKIIIENAEQYFELSGKKTLSQAEKLKLQISEKVVKQVSVKSMDDVAAIKRMYEQANTKAEQLKQRYNSLEKRFNEYTDIAQYYKKLSRTDYITELINEQKRRPNKLE